MRINIRSRLILLIATIIFIFIASFVYFINFQRKVFVSLFEEETRHFQLVFDSILNLKGELLETHANDYTYWDEMVEFVNSPNAEWGEQNIVASLSTFKTNFASVYNKDFSLVYSANDLDLEDEEIKQLTFSRDAISNLFKQNKFGHFFVKTEKELWEFRYASIHPTVDTERKTIPQGYFFVGRYWSEDYLTEISSLVGGTLTIGEVGQNKDSSKAINPEKSIIKFSKILNDKDDNPLASINLSFKSPLIEDFNKRFKLTFVYSFIFFGVAIFVAIVFLSWWINIPLELISKTLISRDISFMKNLQNNKDEFGEISKLISESFVQQQKILNEMEQREEATKELSDKMKELEVFNKLSVDRELRMVELKDEIEKLKAQIAAQE